MQPIPESVPRDGYIVRALGEEDELPDKSPLPGRQGAHDGKAANIAGPWND